MAPVRIRFSGFVGSPPKTREQLYGRRFTSAVGAEKGHDFTGTHTEIHAAQRTDVSVILVYAFETGDDQTGARSAYSLGLILRLL
jgi:hypothetical protein